MRLLALIPARGGSKGIPKKNIKMFSGKPLIAHTIEEALKVSKIEKVVVSTDCKEIANVSKSYGADIPFLRPKEYADDNSTSFCVANHLISEFPDFSAILLLQPTSPLRTAEDIRGIIEMKIKLDCKSIISVTQTKTHPYWSYYINDEKTLFPYYSIKSQISRRQDLDPAYIPNGALYLCETNWLKSNKSFISNSSKAFIMPPERSVDIDTIFDWKIAEFLFKNRKS